MMIRSGPGMGMGMNYENSAINSGSTMMNSNAMFTPGTGQELKTN